MITKKRRKSKSKRSRKGSKRSAAARKGWATRRRKKRERIKELEQELEEAREQLKAGEKELPQVPSPKRHLTRKEMIDQFLDRAERLYGTGPGLLDTAKDLADYYEIDIDQIFDEWYEETG